MTQLKTRQKRLDNVAVNMDINQRIRAALAAVKAEDQETLKLLHETAPQRTYTQTDANFCNTMDAVENVGLRVDRAFGRALAERWKATFLCCVGTGDDLDNADRRVDHDFLIDQQRDPVGGEAATDFVRRLVVVIAERCETAVRDRL